MSSINCPQCNCRIDLNIKPVRAPQSVDTHQSNTETVNPSRIGELLEQINEDTLNSSAATFIRELRERHEKYGSTTRMSEKQWKWLNDLASDEMSRF